MILITEKVWWTLMLLITLAVIWFIAYTRQSFFEKTQRKITRFVIFSILCMLTIDWTLAHALEPFMIAISSWQCIILIPAIAFILSLKESDFENK